MTSKDSERTRPSVAIGHLAAERLSSERVSSLHENMEERAERLAERREALEEWRSSRVSDREPDRQGRLSRVFEGVGDVFSIFDLVFEVAFKITAAVLDLAINLIGGILEGIGDLSI